MIVCYFARQHALGSSGLQRLPPLSGLLALGQLEDVSDCHAKWVWKPCMILWSFLWVIPAFLPFPSCIPEKWGKAGYQPDKHRLVLMAAGAGRQARRAHGCVCGRLRDETCWNRAQRRGKRSRKLRARAGIPHPEVVSKKNVIASWNPLLSYAAVYSSLSYGCLF